MPHPRLSRISPPSPDSRAWRGFRLSGGQTAQAGFTIIEALAVIAIIGLLVAIIVPATGVARQSALRAKTRVQFSQWAMAIESFRQEYNTYPNFGSTDARWVVNTPGTSTTPSAQHLFHDILMGKRRDGSVLPAVRAGTQPNPPPPEYQNQRRIAFLNFTEADMFPSTYVDTTKRNLLRDAFDNSEIAVLVDRNMDGVIRMGGTGSDYTNPPTVRPTDGATTPLSPNTTDFPRGNTGGVRASVIFYSALPNAKDATELVLSWK